MSAVNTWELCKGVDLRALSNVPFGTSGTFVVELSDTQQGHVTRYKKRTYNTKLRNVNASTETLQVKHFYYTKNQPSS